MRNLVLQYGIFIALGIALLVMVSFMFDRTEHVLQKRFGKFFDPDYFLSQIRLTYKDEIAEWTGKGISDREVMGYIVSKYFDYPKFLDWAEQIYLAKGVISDDENKALSVFRNLNNMGELSYLAKVYSKMKVQDNDTAGAVIANTVATVVTSGMSTGYQKEAGDLLEYVLTYFNERHRELLVALLSKKKKRLPYKSIVAPTFNTIDKVLPPVDVISTSTTSRPTAKTKTPRTTKKRRGKV